MYFFVNGMKTLRACLKYSLHFLIEKLAIEDSKNIRFFFCVSDDSGYPFCFWKMGIAEEETKR